MQTHCRHDLSDGRKRAILSAIRDNGAKHLLLDRHRPGDLGSLNQAYLEFPDRIKTLEWKVFMSNRIFRGGTLGLRQMERDYSVVDATTGLPVSVPFDQREPAKFAMWIEAQDKGDFGLSREAGNDLIAVRGAKLALLNVTNWIEADAIRNDELRAVIEQQHKRRIGLSSYYEAHRNEHSTYPPTEFIRPYIGVMTKEGRLAVVHIEDFSGRAQILYRVRPRG